MHIGINLLNCHHVKTLSHYNHNVYKLPFTINGMGHIQVNYDNLTEDFGGYTIGSIVNGEYESVWWLHTDEVEDGPILIDTDTWHTSNLWT